MFSKRLQKFLIFFFFILLTIVVFTKLLSGGVLFATDNNVADLSIRAAKVPSGFFAAWNESPLLGSSDFCSINWLNMMLWLFPTTFIACWLPAIEFGLSALFFIAFLRLHRCGWMSCLLGAITAYWLGSNFTLIYAGHFGKFGVVLFAAVALYCIEKTILSKRFCWAVFAGGALGKWMGTDKAGFGGQTFILGHPV